MDKEMNEGPIDACGDGVVDENAGVNRRFCIVGKVWIGDDVETVETIVCRCWTVLVHDRGKME